MPETFIEKELNNRVMEFFISPVGATGWNYIKFEEGTLEDASITINGRDDATRLGIAKIRKNNSIYVVGKDVKVSSGDSTKKGKFKVLWIGENFKYVD